MFGLAGILDGPAFATILVGDEATSLTRAE
jgi:hypothetical protein